MPYPKRGGGGDNDADVALLLAALANTQSTIDRLDTAMGTLDALDNESLVFWDTPGGKLASKSAVAIDPAANAIRSLLLPATGTFTAGQIYKTALDGLVIAGIAGTSRDFLIRNSLNQEVARIDTGSTNFEVLETAEAKVLKFRAVTSSTAFSAAIYRPGTKDLGFITNNLEQMRLNIAGNLLIGQTTDTGEKLQVNGDVNADTVTANLLVGPLFPTTTANTVGVAQVRTSAADGLVLDGGSGTANALRIANNLGEMAIEVPLNARTVLFGGGIVVGQDISGLLQVQGTQTIVAPTSIPTNAVFVLISDVISPLAVKLIIDARGDVGNVNNVYSGFSDLKLKENIVDCPDFLKKLMRVRVVNYNHKADTRPDRLKLLGVVAQELEKIFPGLVGESPDHETVPDLDWQPRATVPERVEEIEVEPSRTEERQVTAEKIVKMTDPVVELEDGAYVERFVVRSVTITEPVYASFPLYTAGRNPTGRIHRIPQMETITIPAVTRTETTPAVPGETEADRPKIRRLTGTFTKYIKYSIFVPMLIKALQEMNAKIGEQTDD